MYVSLMVVSITIMREQFVGLSCVTYTFLSPSVLHGHVRGVYSPWALGTFALSLPFIFRPWAAWEG